MINPKPGDTIQETIAALQVENKALREAMRNAMECSQGFKAWDILDAALSSDQKGAK